MRRARDERGAVALVTALVTSFVLIVVAAIAVDLGVQRVARRDMQSLADVVAMDLSRELNGRDVATLRPLMPGLAQASRNRNAGTIGDVPTLDVTLGSVSTSGVFTPMTSGIPTAVRVTAATSVDFAFGVAASGEAARQAVATAQPGGCFSIGSFAVGLKTSDSILRPLLGNAATARVLGYSGVLTPQVSLLGIATELGVGTPQELVALPGLTIGQFLLASAEVLKKQGDQTAAVFAAGLALDLGPLASTPVNLAKLIEVGQGRASALDASIDILNLVGGGLFLANGDNALGLSLGLANVADVKLRVLQRPQIACNDAEARTSQVSLAATLSVLGLIKVRVRVGLAEARGRISSVDCANGKVSGLRVSVTDQTLASVKVAVSVLSGTPADPVPAPSGLATQPPYLLPLDASYTTPVTTNAGSVGLSSTELDAAVLGLNLGAIVMALLKPVLLPAVDALVGSLLAILGVKVAGADLYAVPTPTCANPRLVG